jgi:hypothetical protein
MPREGPRGALRRDARPRAGLEERARAHLGGRFDHVGRRSPSPDLFVPGRGSSRSRSAASALLAAGLLAGISLQKRIGKTEPPTFRQLTFRRGEIQSARFAPDGQTVVYTAAWGGKPMEIFLRRLESPESRPSGLVDAELLAVSSSGDMAVSLNRKPVLAFIRTGRLASTSIAGGVTPREILDDVECADWAPNGKDLALVRSVSGRSRLEYPMGKPLYETAGWIGTPRISRSGDLVAFCDHPTPGDDGGSIAIVDRAGSKKTISARSRRFEGSPGPRATGKSGLRARKLEGTGRCTPRRERVGSGFSLE